MITIYNTDMREKKLTLTRIILGIVIISLCSSGVYGSSFNKEIKRDPLSDPEVQLPPRSHPEYVPGELVVKFKSYIPEEDIGISSYIERRDGFLEKQLSSESIGDLKEKYGVEAIGRVFEESKFIKLEQKETEISRALAKAFPGFEERFGGDHRRTISAISEVDLYSVYKFNLSKDADILAAAKEFSKDPSVEYAEPNYIYHIERTPNDPYYGTSGAWGQVYDDLWGLKKIQCEEAWDYSTGSDEIVVAVVDTGVDYDHEDIASNMWTNLLGKHGFDFVNMDTDPYDDEGHGTHVAGTIAAVGDNSVGVVGVTWDCKIMALKGLNNEGEGTSTALAACINYAANRGVDVISNSWGGIGTSSTINLAINYALNKDCVVVAAAGNDVIDVIRTYPASLKNVIAVSATEPDDTENWLSEEDTKAWFSNYGVKIDVAAPGWDILSLGIGGGYALSSGTSMACPHVAGLAALIRSYDNGLTAEEVVQIIRSSADDIVEPLDNEVDYTGFDIFTGYGRINAYKALKIDSVCIARIDSPTYEDTVSGKIDIVGTAKGDYFEQYVLEYGIGRSPKVWDEIITFTSEVEDGKLSKNQKWDTTSLKGGEYTLRLTVTDQGGNNFYDRVNIFIDDEHIATGWPIKTEGAVYSSPLLANIDGDTELEIIVSSNDGKIHAWNYDSSYVSGWPVELVNPFNDERYTLLSSSPAIGDIDGDSEPEIVVLSNSAYRSTHKATGLHAFNGDGTYVTGWPIYDTEPYFYNYGYLVDPSPVLENLDNDPELEIVFTIPSMAVGDKQKIIIKEGNGSDFSGWPIKILADNLNYSTPIIVDIDKDTEKEIIFQEYNDSSDTFTVHVWNLDGSYVDGWPIGGTGGESYDATGVIGDIDGIRDFEIVFTVYSDDPKGFKIYAYNHDASPVGGNWPVFVADEFINSTPVLADFDGNGDQEIVIALEGGKLQVYEGNGTKIWQWASPNTDYMNSSPAVGDIDGDGDMEIVVGTSGDKKEEYGRIYAFSYDSGNFNLLSGYPKRTNVPVGTSSPALGDIDQDGDIELVVGTGRGWTLEYIGDLLGTVSQSLVYVYDLLGDYDESNMEWPMYRRNLQHTGVYPLPPNQAPVVSGIPDISFVEDGSDNSIDLDDYVSDPDHSDVDITWTYMGNTQVNISIDPATRIVTFTSANNWFGSETITFIAIDPEGASDNDSMILTATAVNDAPVSIDDSYGVNEGGTITEGAPGVLVNDTDAEGDDLTAILVNDVSHGTLTLNTNGSFTYIHDGSETVSDSFTYKANDGIDDSNVATVTITIKPVNDAPVANDQVISALNEGGSVDITLTATDVDIGDTLTYTIVTQPSNGTLSGTEPNVTYTPDSDYNGPDSFTFKANDGVADSNIATVSIIVIPVNDAPVVSDIPDISFAEGSSDNSLDLDDYVTDIDNNDSELTWTYAGNTNVNVAIAVNRKVTFTATADWSGSETISFTATDPDGASDSDDVSVTVTPVNDAPVANGQSVALDEDASLDITLTALDPESDTLSYEITNQTSYGTLSKISVNTFRYIPEPNYTGPDFFKFRVHDGKEYSSKATVDIVVNSVNDPPHITNSILDISFLEDGLDTSIDLDSYVNDVDHSANELVWTYTGNNNVNVSIDSVIHIVTLTAEVDWYGEETITFTATDPEGASVGDSITVTVTPGNDIPISKDQNVSLDEDTSLNIALIAQDIDNDSLTYALVTSPNKGTLTGTLPNVSYTPNQKYHGTDSFTFRVNDGEYNSNIATVSITVNSVNDPPEIIASIPDISFLEDTSDSSLDLDDYVRDVDHTDSELTWSYAANNKVNINIDSHHRVTFTAEANWYGEETITFNATDPEGDSVSDSIKVTVTSVDDTPYFEPSIGNREVNEGELLEFTVIASDPDGDSLVYSVTNLPEGASYDPHTQRFSWQPDYDHTGIYEEIYFEVSDATYSDSEYITITVNDVNRLPVLSPIGNKTVDEGQPLVFTITASDLDNDTLIYKASRIPEGASFDRTIRTFIWIPTYDQAGEYNIQFEVSDGKDSASEDITIRVQNVSRSRGGGGDVIQVTTETSYGGKIETTFSEEDVSISGTEDIPTVVSDVEEIEETPHKEDSVVEEEQEEEEEKSEIEENVSTVSDYVSYVNKYKDIIKGYISYSYKYAYFSKRYKYEAKNSSNREERQKFLRKANIYARYSKRFMQRVNICQKKIQRFKDIEK